MGSRRQFPRRRRRRRDCSIHRELEGGFDELTDVDLPAVLTIQTGINDPRYASLRGIRQAQLKPLDVRTLEDLGVDVAGLDGAFELESLYEPETDCDGTLFEGDASDTATQLRDLLQEKGVVEGCATFWPSPDTAASNCET